MRTRFETRILFRDSIFRLVWNLDDQNTKDLSRYMLPICAFFSTCITVLMIMSYGIIGRISPLPDSLLALRYILARIQNTHPVLLMGDMLTFSTPGTATPDTHRLTHLPGEIPVFPYCHKPRQKRPEHPPVIPAFPYFYTRLKPARKTSISVLPVHRLDTHAPHHRGPLQKHPAAPPLPHLKKHRFKTPRHFQANPKSAHASNHYSRNPDGPQTTSPKFFTNTLD